MKILIPDVINDGGQIEKNIFGSQYDVLCYEATEVTQISDPDWKEAKAILAFDQLVYDKKLIDK